MYVWLIIDLWSRRPRVFYPSSFRRWACSCPSLPPLWTDGTRSRPGFRRSPTGPPSACTRPGYSVRRGYHYRASALPSPRLKYHTQKSFDGYSSNLRSEAVHSGLWQIKINPHYYCDFFCCISFLQALFGCPKVNEVDRFSELNVSLERNIFSITFSFRPIL